MAKAAFNKKRALFTRPLGLELRKKLVKCYIWSIALYGAETWTLWLVNQKHLESFEMWCWRRMEKISWTDHVRNEDVLLRVREQRNIIHEINKRKANWIGHILRRNCLLQPVIEGKIKGRIEVTRWWGRRCRKLLDDLQDRREYSHMKEEALDRTVWRAGFGRGFGPVVRQTTKWMNSGLWQHVTYSTNPDTNMNSSHNHSPIWRLEPRRRLFLDLQQTHEQWTGYVLYKTAGSHRGVAEDSSLLGCNTVWLGEQFLAILRITVLSYPEDLGTTIQCDVRNYSTSNTALYLKRLEPPSTLLL